jgi:hypothetical protein
MLTVDRSVTSITNQRRYRSISGKTEKKYYLSLLNIFYFANFIKGTFSEDSAIRVLGLLNVSPLVRVYPFWKKSLKTTSRMPFAHNQDLGSYFSNLLRRSKTDNLLPKDLG